MSERVTSTIGKYPEDSLWHKYFMGIALISAKRSKDKNRKVGACVVNDEPRVIGTGYNGMQLGQKDSKIWGPHGLFPQGTDKEKLKHLFVCHAELNAIINLDQKSVKACTLYTTLFPCSDCAKIILKSGIKRVVYLSDDKCEKPSYIDSRKMFGEAKNVEIDSYTKLVEKSKVANVEKECIRVGVKSSEPEQEVKKEVLSWENYFMAFALWSGKFQGEGEDKGKDGECIVNKDNRVVGLGYVQNFEADCAVYKDNCVMHAPVNAIVNHSPTSLRDCTLYTVRYPCLECIKAIAQSGITKITNYYEEVCQDGLPVRPHINPESNEENDSQKMKMTVENLSLDFTPKRRKMEEDAPTTSA